MFHVRHIECASLREARMGLTPSAALAAAVWSKNTSNESHRMATEARTSSPISARGMNISLITPSAVSHRVAGAQHPPACEGFCLSRFSLILLFSFILLPPPLQSTSVQEAIETHWPTNRKQQKAEDLGWGDRSVLPCTAAAWPTMLTSARKFNVFVFFCLLGVFGKTSITFAIAHI